MDSAALPYSHGYAGIGHAKAPIEPESAEAKSAPADENKFWGDDGFSFGDLIDLINPLQHLPVVSTIYRAITNDEIAPGPRMVGGAVFGGPLGFVSAVANTLVEDATGKDVGEHLMAFAGLGPDETEPDATREATVVQTAALTSSSTPSGSGTTEATPATATATVAAAASSPASPIPQAPTHAVNADAVAKYGNTVWGALLAAQRSGAVGTQQPLQPLPMPASAVRSAGQQASHTNDSATEPSAAWQVEHLSAQELAERLLLYTKAFEANAAASNRSPNRSY